MRDHEDLTAFEVLILALLLDDDTTAKEVTTQESEASIPPGEKRGARD